MKGLVLLQCLAALLLAVSANTIIDSNINSNNTNNTNIADLNKLQTEVLSLRSRIAELEKERAAGYGICHIKKPCGASGCKCVEDCNVPEQYYCDCREAKPIRRDCKEHHTQGERLSGLYKTNNNRSGSVVEVYCDQTTDGGGWTVVQRRVDGSENFYRIWDEYKRGFGKLQREHWLGNDNLHFLTLQGPSEVRFDLVARGKTVKEWVKYSEFSVGDRWTYYRLRISGPSQSGTFRGSRFANKANGAKFSAYDKDQDSSSPTHCARSRYGGWWYDWGDCTDANLNGRYEVYKIPGNDQDRKSVV